MRVLQAVTGLGVGGAERVVHDLATSLPGLGVDVHVVSFSSDTKIFDVAGRPDVPVKIFDIVGPRMLGIWRLIPFAAHLDEKKPEIVHAHMFHALCFALLGKAIAKHKPKIVFTSHSAEIRTPARRAFLTWTRRLRCADVLLFEGQHPALNAARVAVIRNGVPRSRVGTERKASRPFRVISVGRFSEPKNHLGLLRAFAKADLKDARLVLVGDGPLRQSCEQAAEALGIAGQVEFLGLRADVRELLRTADLFAMHSRWEGLPLALLEAGAEGLPVLATPVGSIPQVLAEGRGFLAEPAEFADQLRYVSTRPEEARRRGEALHSWVAQHCSIEGMARAHCELYEDICGAEGVR